MESRNLGTKPNALGFPPPLLGHLPVRLPILRETETWLALAKPQGVGTREHPWDVGVPNLDTALNRELGRAKPELLRTKASVFGSVYYLEPEASGIALFGKNRQSIAALRDAYGSDRLEYRFLFVARHYGEKIGVERRTEVPLRFHPTKPKASPSAVKGKKSLTLFRLLSISSSGWSLWEAVTRFFRGHQVRAHAAVSGIPVLGDACYGGPSVPVLGELYPKKHGAGMSSPVFEGIALHLNQVAISSDGSVEGGRIEAAFPPRFRTLLRHLGLSFGIFEEKRFTVSADSGLRNFHQNN